MSSLYYIGLSVVYIEYLRDNKFSYFIIKFFRLELECILTFQFTEVGRLLSRIKSI